MSCEYEDLESQEEIGQGDVIAWQEGAIERPWKHFGVVITADCDLARHKHGGFISYLPAFSTEDFLWHVWRPQAFAKTYRDRADKLASRLQGWSEKNGTPVTLSAEAVIG